MIKSQRQLVNSVLPAFLHVSYLLTHNNLAAPSYPQDLDVESVRSYPNQP
jgi:hypothetical protein